MVRVDYDTVAHAHELRHRQRPMPSPAATEGTGAAGLHPRPPTAAAAAAAAAANPAAAATGESTHPPHRGCPVAFSPSGCCYGGGGVKRLLVGVFGAMFLFRLGAFIAWMAVAFVVHVALPTVMCPLAIAWWNKELLAIGIVVCLIAKNMKAHHRYGPGQAKRRRVWHAWRASHCPDRRDAASCVGRPAGVPPQQVAAGAAAAAANAALFAARAAEAEEAQLQEALRRSRQDAGAAPALTPAAPVPPTARTLPATRPAPPQASPPPAAADHRQPPSAVPAAVSATNYPLLARMAEYEAALGLPTGSIMADVEKLQQGGPRHATAAAAAAAAPGPPAAATDWVRL